MIIPTLEELLELIEATEDKKEQLEKELTK
jgi:hypothetical protein